MALDRNLINVFRLGFDNVWDYVPNLTLRQTLLMIITGIVSLQGFFQKKNFDTSDVYVIESDVSGCDVIKMTRF